MGILQAIREAFGEEKDNVHLGDAKDFHGKILHSRPNLPLPTRAAELLLDGDIATWIPIPLEDCKGVATGPCSRFKVAGTLYSFPIVRLVEKPKRGPVESIKFLRFHEILRDALTIWTFRPTPWGAKLLDPDGGQTTPVTPSRFLSKLEKGGRKTGLVAVILEWLLFGSRPPLVNHARALGIELPISSGLLVKVHQERVWSASSTWMVETLFITPDPASEPSGAGAEPNHGDVPPKRQGTSPRHATRWNPSAILGRMSFHRESPDHGIDPFRTPEGGGIRFQGLLGMDTVIKPDGSLECKGGGPALALPTRMIPFLGHNDHRRILVGSNYIRQAVELSKPGVPLDSNNDGNLDIQPPGANLRVAYMAYRGLNHEDAIVVSESAANKLERVRRHKVVVHVPSTEEKPKELVKKGLKVAKGKQLAARRSRKLLTDDFSAPDMLQHDGGLFSAAIHAREPGTSPSNLSPCDGTIEEIEWFKLDASRGNGSIHVDPACLAKWRGTLTFTIREEVPLRVGDKLSNRHGAKGIVGAIVPDKEMPRWRGEPLEVLLDPVGVVNRGNWGQVMETLAGRDGGPFPREGWEKSFELPKDGGLQDVEPAVERSWTTTTVKAVAGQQFMMRMQQNALEKASQFPLGRVSKELRIKKKEQRFNHQYRFAAWARGLPTNRGSKFREGVLELSNMLKAAGFLLELNTDRHGAILSRMPLDGEPSFPVVKPPPAKARLELQKLIDSRPNEVVAYKLRGKVTVKLPWGGRGQVEPLEVAWVAIPPGDARKPLRVRDGKRDHPVVRSLKKLIKEDLQGTDAQLALATRNYLLRAYQSAIGTSNSQDKANTYASKVQRQDLGHSLSGIIAPAGGDLAARVGLGQVGLPGFMCEALENVGGELPGRVWITRPPVLHRWGLLSVEPVRLDGNDPVIRLHPAILGALGADFDGDTGYIFRDIPTHPGRDPGAGTRESYPEASLWDEVLREAKFVAGKQYRHGLWLAFQAGDQALEEILDYFGVPKSSNFDESIRGLMGRLSGDPETGPLGPSPDGYGEGGPLGPWTLLDAIAMRHLAGDPGMGFRIPAPQTRLADLPLVKSGAAKLDQAEIADTFLGGNSLAGYPFGGSDSVTDPVGEIMQVSKLDISTFGSALKKLVHQARPGSLTEEFIRASQGFTERITQRALSVKAGNRPFPKEVFREIMGELLSIQPGNVPDFKEWRTHLGDERGNERGVLEEALEKLAGTIARGATIKPGKTVGLFESDAATRFLRKPANLRRILLEMEMICDLYAILGQPRPNFQKWKACCRDDKGGDMGSLEKSLKNLGKLITSIVLAQNGESRPLLPMDPPTRSTGRAGPSGPNPQAKVGMPAIYFDLNDPRFSCWLE